MGRIRPEPPPPPEALPGREAGAARSSPRPCQLPLPAAPIPASPARGATSPRPLCRLPGAWGGGVLTQAPKVLPPPPGFGGERSTPERRPRSRGRGTHDAGARTGAFGSGQIPGIQLKSWLAPLAGRRSRGICIMKIDSSKLPAWQPGRAPAGGGDPAAPAGAPAAGGAGGAGGRTPRAAGRGAAAGAAGTCPGGKGERPPRLSQAFQRGGWSNLPREKRPYLWSSSSSNNFSTSPKRCTLLHTCSSYTRL